MNGGGVVSILKSGTNQFHGSAYGYVQDFRLNANTWQNNQQVPKIPIQPFSQSQFGGALGGPIKRNKLFFFVDYLGSRYHQGGTGSASVFTQAMRNGDFSVLLNQANPIQLYNPENGFAAYPDNKGIPVINPVAKFLFLIRNSTLCQTRCRRMESSTTTSRDRRAVIKRTTRAILRSNSTPVRPTKSLDFIPCPRRMTDPPRCSPSASQA